VLQAQRKGKSSLVRRNTGPVANDRNTLLPENLSHRERPRKEKTGVFSGENENARTREREA